MSQSFKSQRGRTDGTDPSTLARGPAFAICTVIILLYQRGKGSNKEG
ncbi:hypothetical protein SAMN05216316_2965 [Nitrosovibrio sp. Nv6]|nr:hypothetical protein SAMN05216316_2965 [Nitrosovibrio sp. Nv6]